MIEQVRDAVPIGDSGDGIGALLQLYFDVSVDDFEEGGDSASAFEILVIELIGNAHSGEPFAYLGLYPTLRHYYYYYVYSKDGIIVDKDGIIAD